MRLKKTVYHNCIALAAALLIIAQSFGQHQAKSRAYYVSLSGDDGNAGTKTAPFKTINKVNSLNLKPGDTVYFRSGQVFNGSLLIVQGVNGTLNKPVVITSYGGGHATIDAKDSVGINIYKGAYIKLQRLALVGSGRKTGNIKNGLAVNAYFVPFQFLPLAIIVASNALAAV